MTSGAALTLYNSLTRSLEHLTPIDPANVRVYSCGPTVYNYAHIGNLRAYVFTDTLSRVLRWKGYGLTHIINITDVGHLTSDADAGDDKMEAAARATSQSIWDIAAHYTEAFKSNLRDLNIRAPDLFPLATDHIAEMIEFAAKIAPQHCYELAGGLYFDISTVPNYGRLARVSDDEREGRIDPVEGKRHPQDFAIWRKSAPGENRQMEWDSPWGRGAPGWHLECSVMSKKYLIDPFGGDHFDIHTGGIDHREIHHPNEIAQNQAHCACADTGASIWMHNNFLVDRAEKMSKSSGEFTRLQTLVDRGFHPLAYRLMCLQAHYRSELEFSYESLAAALVRLKRLVLSVEALVKAVGDGAREHPSLNEEQVGLLRQFDDAVSRDLLTPNALTFLDQALAEKRWPAGVKLWIVEHMDQVFGLSLTTLTRADLRVQPVSATFSGAEIESRLADRRQARVAKDFARSDSIRDALSAAGIEVMDGDPLGWDWKVQ